MSQIRCAQIHLWVLRLPKKVKYVKKEVKIKRIVPLVQLRDLKVNSFKCLQACLKKVRSLRD